MLILFVVIVQKIITSFNVCCEDMAEGIEQNNWKQVVLNIVLVALMVAGCVVAGFLILCLAIKFWWIILVGFILVWSMQALLEKANMKAKTDIIPSEGNTEFIRQSALDVQEYVLNFMFRVLVAISPLTPVIRPQTAQDIAILATDGASFYLDKDGNVIYHVEAEIEGEVTFEVENVIYQKTRQYALKYIPDYPMLISPDICGRAPVDILRVKNGGDRVIIDFVFTSQKNIKLVDDCLKVWIEWQKRQERPRPYVDDDYGE